MQLPNGNNLKNHEGDSGRIHFNVNGVRCVFGGCVNEGYAVDYCWYIFTDDATCEGKTFFFEIVLVFTVYVHCMYVADMGPCMFECFQVQVPSLARLAKCKLQTLFNKMN